MLLCEINSIFVSNTNDIIRIMKKITILVLLLVSMIANAQRDVTKFLGIPVDGLKPAMIQKLKGKGFVYNQRLDCLTGEFNGQDVRISIATNNNKVWRIMIQDTYPQDETGIKIRFNKLIQQFQKNEKYILASLSDPTLSDSEDISYEMLVNKKRYEAIFYQLPAHTDTLELLTGLEERLAVKYTLEQIENPTEDIQDYMTLEVFMYMLEFYSKRSVWFMIDEQYGQYRILMYYDNEYNHSDGEDL